jgi:2-phospho-L-lactate/phosphoenolpyruvate guanylyltransferase
MSEPEAKPEGDWGIGPVSVLIPVKAFADAKLRLAPAMTGVDRAALARSMAERVVHAAAPLPVAIVCDDDDVVAWAASHGLDVIVAPGRGLNRAVETGVDELAARGATQVIVAHADLPLATDLTWVARFPGVTLIPDRRDDGTNVACVPTNAGFRFAYGAGSFTRHVTEARARGLALHIVRDAELGWDIDQPDDLAIPVPV